MSHFDDYVQKKLLQKLPNTQPAQTGGANPGSFWTRADAADFVRTAQVMDAFKTLTVAEISTLFDQFLVDSRAQWDTGPIRNLLREVKGAYERRPERKWELTQILGRLGDHLLAHPGITPPRERVLGSKPAAGSGSLVQQIRPLRPGFSIAGKGVAAGTIGGFVKSQGRVYVLSNAHVLSSDVSNANSIDDVVQPATADGGGNVVGRVAYQFPIVTETTASSATPPADQIDAALAMLFPSSQVQPSYDRIGFLKGVRNPKKGEMLRMVCRTSGFIEAEVDDTDHLLTDVNMHQPNSATADFAHCVILMNRKSEWTNRGGDSGGLWIGQDNFAVALNFSGGEDTAYAGAFPILRVLEYFQHVSGDGNLGLMGEGETVFAR